MRLFHSGILSANDCKKIEEDTMKRCEEAVEFARNSEFPKPEEAFEDMWANPIPLP